MLFSSPLGRRPLIAALLVALLGVAPAARSFAQDAAPPSVKFKVNGPAERLEMTVNTSRVLEFPFDVPKMLVNNPDLVRVIPVSPNSIQLSAVKAGVTQLNVWSMDDKVTSIDLVILGDVQELELVLKTEFPDASLRLRPLNSSLYISGFVPKAEMVGSIVRVAEDYFPRVVNNMTVGGVQKVLLHVKVMEVSRTKLRTLGFDWAVLGEQAFVSQGVGGLINNVGNATGTPSTVRFGIVDGNTQFYGFLEALRQNDLAKLLAEPTLTTLNGRPASFNVGGEVPVLVPQSLGTVTIEYREFGTQVDFVPIVLGNGVVRLEVRPQITELDNSLSVTVNGAVIPGFRQRRADVGVEMKAGQTLAIAGLVYNRVEAQNKGIPWIADVPWFGVPFRRVTEKNNEVELVIMVTPEFAEAMDPCEVPPCGPGQLTASPTDVELYYRGYLETPKSGCKDGDCGGPYPGGAPGYPQIQGGMPLEQLPPSQPTPAGAQARRPMNYQASQPVRQGPAARTASARTTVGDLPSAQTPNSRYQPQSAGQKPAAAGQPALIGPLGYDDLK